MQKWSKRTTCIRLPTLNDFKKYINMLPFVPRFFTIIMCNYFGKDTFFYDLCTTTLLQIPETNKHRTQAPVCLLCCNRWLKNAISTPWSFAPTNQKSYFLISLCTIWIVCRDENVKKNENSIVSQTLETEHPAQHHYNVIVNVHFSLIL